MTRARAVAILQSRNPPSRAADIAQYVSCFMTYLEAASNLDRNGAVVAHPRTAGPIENPYLKVRTIAMADMAKLKSLKGIADLWTALDDPGTPSVPE